MSLEEKQERQKQNSPEDVLRMLHELKKESEIYRHIVGLIRQCVKRGIS